MKHNESSLDIGVVISTVKKTDYNFINNIFIRLKNNIDFKTLIINQSLNKSKKIKSNYFNNILVISDDYVGLSRSRNLGLKYSNSKYVLLTDDDIVLSGNFIEKINNAFKKFKNADIITFRTQTHDYLDRKKYKIKPFKHNYFTIGSVSSIEMVIKLENIRKKNIFYDTDFGLGSSQPTGEEFLFLKKCLDNKLQLYYVPEVLCYHDLETSNTFLTKQLIISKGALIKTAFPSFYILLFLYFTLKHYKKSDFNFLVFYKLMLNS